MMHILIVEDEPVTREAICDYLAEEYPGAVIHSAETVDEAHQKIDAARRANIKFSVAVLDARLPKSEGEHPEVETGLRRRVLNSGSRDTVVFYVTAFPHDPLIKKFVSDVQREQVGSGWPLLISKLDADWTEQLYRGIAAAVHRTRISRRVDRLFGELGSAGLDAHSARLEPRGGADPTHELAALTRDAAQHWKYLDEKLKDRIREIFSVREGDGGKVTISLL